MKTSLTFRYGDLSSLKALFDRHPGEIACVIMEAATMADPPEGYLAAVGELCRREGAVFVIDEMITGFRWHNQGAQGRYGVEADLATFGKGMANGFSLAALVGRKEIMQLGGLEHDRPRVFLMSTTHGAENHALAAGMATLEIFRTEPVVETMWRVGAALIEGLNEAARAAGIGECFQAGGVACSPWYKTLGRDGAPSWELRTLFLQEMVKGGILCNYLAPSYSHGREHVDATLEAARKALSVYAQALDDGVEKYLTGPAVKPVFRSFN